MSDIVDINTLFGPAPIAASDLSVDDLSALMARHSVGACCTLSTLGILLDPGAGNTATRAAAAENPRLVPVATYNPLTCHGHDGAHIHPRADGFRMVRFFPALQGWPPRFASRCPRPDAVQPGCGTGESTWKTWLPVGASDASAAAGRCGPRPKSPARRRRSKQHVHARPRTGRRGMDCRAHTRAAHFVLHA